MIRIISICLFSILISASICIAQNSSYWNKESPYELSLKKDITISSLSLGILIWGINKEKNETLPNFQMGSFTDSDILEINKFDRIVAGDWNVEAKDKGKIFKNCGNIILPITAFALPGDIKGRASLGLIFFQGRMLNGGLVSLAKGSTKRYRPFSYMQMDDISLLTGEAEEEFHEDIVDDDIEDSFYSGDAASTAYGFMFFAKVFNDNYPDSKWKPIVWSAAGIGTGLGAYFRARSGKHFPTDVLIGSIVGGGLGIIIPHLHKRKNDKLSIDTNQDGLSLVYKF